jgi:hypothetical protein
MRKAVGSRMNFDFSDEQKLLGELTRKFLAQNCTLHREQRT